ncbi:hypothetical protein LY78DRAFT_717852, partial [Colletotrichum sublineola]
IVILSHISKHQLTNMSVNYHLQEVHQRLSISNMGQKYINVICPRVYKAIRAHIDKLRASPVHSSTLAGVVDEGGQLRLNVPCFLSVSWMLGPGWDGDVSEPPYDNYDMQRADRNEACVIQDEVEERQQQEEDGREAGDSVVRIELEAVSAPAPAIPLPGPAPAPVGSLGLPSGPSRSMDEAGPRTGPEVSPIQGSPPLCPFQRPGAAGSARPESHRAALRRSRVFQPGCTKIPLLVGGVTVPLLISHHQYPVRDAAVALAGSSPRRRGLVLSTPDHITREMLTQYKATTMRLVELDMERRLCDVEVAKCHVLGDAETAESRTHRGRQIGAAAHDVRARLVYLDRELGKGSYTSGSQGLGLVAALSLVPLGLASEGLMWSGAR